jgi:hypothetical protein
MLAKSMSEKFHVGGVAANNLSRSQPARLLLEFPDGSRKSPYHAMRREGETFLNELMSRRNIFATLQVLSIPGES